jgi:hypothetical protein
LQNRLTQLEVEFLELLTVGEPVEMFDDRGNVQWRGTVEQIAVELGVAWIRTDMGERRMLDIREHSVRRFPRPEVYYLEPPG